MWKEFDELPPEQELVLVRHPLYGTHLRSFVYYGPGGGEECRVEVYDDNGNCDDSGIEWEQWKEIE